MVSRRQFLGASAVLAGASLARSALAAPEIATHRGSATLTRSQLPDSSHTPFTTLNGWSLPHRVVDGVKEFHLVAEKVEREFAPGMVVNCLGYNGQTPGPTIEAIEGDRVRIFVTNRLGEHTSVHWHGVLLPCGMDGVAGLTQPHIPPGKTFVYEFELKKPGTFLYHPHADEMFQLAMGMMGMLVVHPRDQQQDRVDRDFGFLLHSWYVDPGTRTPDPTVMTDFNIWSFNSRVFPAIDPLVVRRGDRVRIRMGNLSMTNHPMHLHGYEFSVTSTGGGRVPESARWPEVTVDVPVGSVRVIEFVADEPGDWAFHCHKSHHTMGPMGHRVSNMYGVDPSGVAEKIQPLVPGHFMPMGRNGMADMAEMQAMGMPLPDNTLPMMTGTGPFGPLEMGGMFTVLKVRDDVAHGDYRDPGWYRHPPGTVAREVGIGEKRHE